MNRSIFYSLLIVLTLSVIALGQEGRITRFDQPYGSALMAGNGNNPPPSIALQNITDTLSDYVIGHSAVHQVGFQLPHFDDQPVGLLRGRQVVITFPPEFDVSAIHSVSYSDTDDESADPKIEGIYLYTYSVVIRFKDKVPGPESPHFAYLQIHSMDNPMRVGSYRVMVTVDNTLGQTIAGPGYSELFRISSDEAQSLVISPANDTTLRAGDGIDFEATAVDQYGNPIETDRITWSIDPGLDPIGQMYGSFFKATTAGQGRIIASVDGLEAHSGFITVLSGEFVALVIELDETHFVGSPFRGVAYVFVQDEYGNYIADFNESGVDLHLSSPSGTITPAILPADQFVGGMAVLWSHTYNGRPGRVVLEVSDNAGVEGSAEFYANGVYAEFDEGYNLAEWLLTNWEFYSRGWLWNPANLTPVSVSIEAGFVDSDASETIIGSLRDCIPLPFNERDCRFTMRQLADMTPGTFEYIFKVEAVYEYESDTITTQWTRSREIQVDEFSPFAYASDDLPSSGVADNYVDSSTATLFNTNFNDRSISVSPGLFIRSDNIETYLGSASFPFGWESEKEFDIVLSFNPEIPVGLYSYIMKTKAYYFPDDRQWRISYFAEFDMDAQIEILAPEAHRVRIMSVSNNALNAPYVNIEQEFSISGVISNLSSVDLEGPFILELTTDGQSQVPPPVTLDMIPVFDTLKVISFTVTAATESNAAEIFTLNIISAPDDVQIVQALDNNAAAIIQTPANLSLAARIAGQPGSIAHLRYGQEFEIEAEFVNTGQSQVDGGSVVLSYTGPGDFGIEFPDEQPFEMFVPWMLTAPNENITSNFTVGIGNIPIDRNTGEPAIIAADSVDLNFEIAEAGAKLIIQADDFNTRPLERGVPSKLFELSLQNNTADSRNTLGLKHLEINLVDRDGRPINASAILDETAVIGSNFYLDGVPVAERAINTERLVYLFSNLAIQAGQVIKLEYRILLRSDASIDFFNMRLTGEMILAEIIEGPLSGQEVPVTGLLDRIFEINIPQAIIPEEFAASFKNYPNPFNPMVKPTEIRYNLPSDSDVDIYIYSAIGEEVRHIHFDAGAHGGQAGLNTGIYWDGYNGNGDLVLNGVYVAYIEVASPNLTATVKMAVVK